MAPSPLRSILIDDFLTFREIFKKKILFFSLIPMLHTIHHFLENSKKDYGGLMLGNVKNVTGTAQVGQAKPEPAKIAAEVKTDWFSSFFTSKTVESVPAQDGAGWVKISKDAKNAAPGGAAVSSSSTTTEVSKVSYPRRVVTAVTEKASSVASSGKTLAANGLQALKCQKEKCTGRNLALAATVLAVGAAVYYQTRTPAVPAGWLSRFSPF
jgi:hypothetical protein